MGKVYTGTGTAENGLIRLADPEGLPARLPTALAAFTAQGPSVALA